MPCAESRKGPIISFVYLFLYILSFLLYIYMPTHFCQPQNFLDSLSVLHSTFYTFMCDLPLLKKILYFILFFIYFILIALLVTLIALTRFFKLRYHAIVVFSYFSYIHYYFILFFLFTAIQSTSTVPIRLYVFIAWKINTYIMNAFCTGILLILSSFCVNTLNFLI